MLCFVFVILGWICHTAIYWGSRIFPIPFTHCKLFTFQDFSALFCYYLLSLLILCLICMPWWRDIFLQFFFLLSKWAKKNHLENKLLYSSCEWWKDINSYMYIHLLLHLCKYMQKQGNHDQNFRNVLIFCYMYILAGFLNH